MLLSAHVLAGILCVGPVTVAASLFPTSPTAEPAVARVVHRITCGYGTLAVPLRASTGVFNLLWVVVVVLMIVRPGAGYRRGRCCGCWGRSRCSNSAASCCCAGTSRPSTTHGWPRRWGPCTGRST